MDAESLSRFLELPEVHRRLLAGYAGPYSLGVGQASGRSGVPVLVLHVAAKPSSAFPDHLELEGESVPVVVKRNFVAPSAYQGTAVSSASD
jgi:hypothetical protein